MSQALYKFLRKAQLAGEPGAENIAARIGPEARLLIMRRIAALKGNGEGAFYPFESSKFKIGDTARGMLEEAQRTADLAPKSSRLGPTWSGAVERWNDWLNGIRRKD